MKNRALGAFQPQLLAVLLMGSCMGQAQAQVALSPYQDTKTGLLWVNIRLADGEAAGFRVATSAEFATLLGDAGWTSQAGAGQQFLLPTANQATPGSTNMALGGGWTNYEYENISTLQPNIYRYSYGSGGLLADGNAAAISSDAFTTDQYCKTTASGGTSCTPKSVSYTLKAIIGNFDQLKAGAYDGEKKWSATTVHSGALVTGASQDNPGQWIYHSLFYQNTYFMIAAVPEPSTWALMGLGLIAVTVAARRPALS